MLVTPVNLACAAHSVTKTRALSVNPFGVRSGPCSAVQKQRNTHVARAEKDGQNDWFKKLVDFESWAPRSSRFWRLQQYDYESSTKDDEAPGKEMSADDLEKLSRRVSEASSTASANLSSLDEPTPIELPLQRSFSEAGDGELAAALSQRISQIATASEDEAEEDEQQAAPMEVAMVPLTAAELRELIFTKYGKSYDMSIVRRDIPGKAFVCVNIMWSHLEQRSFKLTEEQYIEKLDSICYVVNALEQAEVVRSFLKTPAKSQKGLPPRPVVGTAISIQLNLSQATVDEW
eukprot:CAMPEP_0202911572 /NCGR_PEP_ID=MMETSP1392-20130828/55338_1 /ASSEMBLY_ACC=CAM_ASM_000868 /TAXON_ID=225041 /ORGANISM="Chlamydomonas chlamydogama, Strain SAG 11-48b" /LENGTH=289 /DNA_ID=CAMNT_0049602127 /DNA_START=104 /DNA_END=970 /DNA_ORIENTATION=-